MRGVDVPMNTGMAALRPTLCALLLALAVGWMGTETVAFTDYEAEAEPAALALASGDLGRFADLAPAYGGSLVLRAPAAWAAHALGVAHHEGLYRALVAPALLLAVGLALFLWDRLRRASPGGAWLALVLAVANPLCLRALEVGHPEEIIGGVLCLAAMLAALRDRWLLAGVLLGLAGANKPWAALAALPVLLALEHRRLPCAAIAAGVCGAVLAPLVIAGSAAQSVAAVATARTEIFQPWQVFWFFGGHDGVVRGLTSEKVGYRTSVDWAQAISHPLVVLAGVGLALAWWPRRRREDVFALLALVMLTRCLLDTWDTDYYAVPFLFALLGHEVVARGRAPLGTLAATLVLWTSFGVVTTPDLQAASFLAGAVTAWAALALAVFAPSRAAAIAARLQGAAARALPSLQPAS